MSAHRPDPVDVARFLRQRMELGGAPLVLSHPDRDGVLEALRGASSASAGPSPSLRPAPPAQAGTAQAGTGDEPEGAGSTPFRPEPPMREEGATAEPRVKVQGSPPSPAAPLPRGYEALREAAHDCTRCALSAGRTKVVFSDGSPDARVMVVGEAPGAQEDRTGLPFVGPAGKLLDLLLESVGLSRGASVYICNVIKCRPPGNRNPLPEEIASCAPFLRGQIERVRPDAILAVGTFAAQWLTGSDRPLGKLRGEVYRYEGTPLVVTYHPAALLRNSGWIRPTWEDFQLLQSVLERTDRSPDA